ncbi:hypothetical protein ACH4U7_07535 [Streptomyces sp. NPDC020845]|uniref:hypothetical protein n=1 Tax=Streptomyces sp. NPDC020845 TaxID=3365096 RepID=UPI0037A8E861
MSSPTAPPQQGQNGGQHGQGGQQQDSDDRPTLEDLRRQSVALGEQITQHLGRGSK